MSRCSVRPAFAAKLWKKCAMLQVESMPIEAVAKLPSNTL